MHKVKLKNHKEYFIGEKTSIDQQRSVSIEPEGEIEIEQRPQGAPCETDTEISSVEYMIPTVEDLSYAVEEHCSNTNRGEARLNIFAALFRGRYRNKSVPITALTGLSYGFTHKIDIRKMLTLAVTRRRIREWWYGDFIPESMQDDFVPIAEVVDITSTETENRDEIENDKRKRRSFIANIVAEVVISIPGIQVDTQANRLVAHHRLFSLCVERGVRPTHTRTILPIALELVFTPSASDIEARMFRNSRVVLDRIRERDRPWYTFEDRWLLNWFGSRRTRTMPATA